MINLSARFHFSSSSVIHSMFVFQIFIVFCSMYRFFAGKWICVYMAWEKKRMYLNTFFVCSRCFVWNKKTNFSFSLRACVFNSIIYWKLTHITIYSLSLSRSAFDTLMCMFMNIGRFFDVWYERRVFVNIIRILNLCHQKKK